DLVDIGAAVRPQPRDTPLPRVEAGCANLVGVVGFETPEERRHLFGLGFGPADRQNPDHDARALVALQQRVFLKAIAAPGERRPERTVGQRAWLCWPVAMAAQLRTRTAGVDDEIEAARHRAIAAGQRDLATAAIEVVDIDPGLDSDSVSHCRTV